MNIFLTLLSYLLLFLSIFLWAYNIVILIYAILSWFPIDNENPLVKFIRGLVEPVYQWLLRFLPPLRIGMLDLSLFYLIILNYILLRLVNALLQYMAKFIA